MIYLVDKPYADVAGRVAQTDKDAEIVLIQDGVLLNPDHEILELDVPVYAVDKDVAVRGAELPSTVERLSYDTLVERILETEVRSFT